MVLGAKISEIFIAPQAQLLETAKSVGPEYEAQVGSLLLHNSLQDHDWPDIQVTLFIHDYRSFRNVLGPIEKE